MRTICALPLFAVATIAALASGCASITSSDIQPLNLTTHTADGKPVENAKCTLRNDKGHWESESPAFVQVRRSSEDLLVECKKEGYSNGFLKAISRAAGGMFGNIIFGGGIGAIIDHSRGSGYNYPEKLPVKMGESLVIDRRDENTPPEDKKGATAAAQ